jgi:hypothetical protein
MAVALEANRPQFDYIRSRQLMESYVPCLLRVSDGNPTKKIARTQDQERRTLFITLNIIRGDRFLQKEVISDEEFHILK